MKHQKTRIVPNVPKDGGSPKLTNIHEQSVDVSPRGRFFFNRNGRVPSLMQLDAGILQLHATPKRSIFQVELVIGLGFGSRSCRWYTFVL